MSQYQLDLSDDLGRSSPEVEKVCPALKLYLSLGVPHQDSSSYGVLWSFIRDPWMAPYIAFNLKLPKQARTEFEKDLFELMNNSVFGNTTENRKKSRKFHAYHWLVLFYNNRVLVMNLCWLALGGQTVKKLASSSVQIWARPKLTQVHASSHKSTQVGGQTKRKLNASPNLASTCESVNNVKTGAKEVQSPPYLSRYGLAPPKDPFVRLWPKLCSILHTERVGHRRTKGVNKAVVRRELRYEQ